MDGAVRLPNINSKDWFDSCTSAPASARDFDCAESKIGYVRKRIGTINRCDGANIVRKTSKAPRIDQMRSGRIEGFKESYL